MQSSFMKLGCDKNLQQIPGHSIDTEIVLQWLVGHSSDVLNKNLNAELSDGKFQNRKLFDFNQSNDLKIYR